MIQTFQIAQDILTTLGSRS